MKVCSLFDLQAWTLKGIVWTPDFLSTGIVSALSER
jgi:hypothetical protein